MLMVQQDEYYSLKSVTGDMFDTLMDVLDSENLNTLFSKAAVLPNDNAFIDFVKFAVIDFVLNLKRPDRYKAKNERSIYCEIFIPIFKALGNCTGFLSYQW